MSRRALFDGLVVDTNGGAVGAATVGDEAQYVVVEDGFRFHVPAEPVDRHVLGQLREQIVANKEAVTEGAMRMMGQDDLFTKAMIDSSLNNMDDHFSRLIEQGLPESARAYLGMLGFRIVLNYHGEVVRFDQPGMDAGPEEE
jgi:hypothetical protein